MRTLVLSCTSCTAVAGSRRLRRAEMVLFITLLSHSAPELEGYCDSSVTAKRHRAGAAGRWTAPAGCTRAARSADRTARPSAGTQSPSCRLPPPRASLQRTVSQARCATAADWAHRMTSKRARGREAGGLGRPGAHLAALRMLCAPSVAMTDTFSTPTASSALLRSSKSTSAVWLVPARFVDCTSSRLPSPRHRTDCERRGGLSE